VVLYEINQERERTQQQKTTIDSKLQADFNRRSFWRIERALHRRDEGPHWLKREDVADLIVNVLKEMDGALCDLDAYCLMSNHAHLVLRSKMPAGGKKLQTPLSAFMQRWKGRTAFECNRVLKRRGQFWEHESYDHVVRNEDEWFRIVRYVLENPIKARLVSDWKQWRWSYCRPEIVS